MLADVYFSGECPKKKKKDSFMLISSVEKKR